MSLSCLRIFRPTYSILTNQYLAIIVTWMEKDEHAQRLFFAHGQTHNSLFKCDNKVPTIALLEGRSRGRSWCDSPYTRREIACIQKEQTHYDNPHTQKSQYLSERLTNQTVTNTISDGSINSTVHNITKYYSPSKDHGDLWNLQETKELTCQWDQQNKFHL